MRTTDLEDDRQIFVPFSNTKPKVFRKSRLARGHCPPILTKEGDEELDPSPSSSKVSKAGRRKRTKAVSRKSLY